MISATSLAQAQSQLQRLTNSNADKTADAQSDSVQSHPARPDALSASTRVTLSSQQAQSLMQALVYTPVQSKNTSISLLKQVNKSSEQAKAAARQRLKQLKDQLEAMKKFAVGLSPRAAKAMAGVLKMLAQQIKAAAAVLGGSSGSVSTPNVDTGSASSASAGDSSAASSSAAVAASAQDGAGDSASTDADDGSAEAGATAKAAADAGVDTSAPAATPTQTASAADSSKEDKDGKADQINAQTAKATLAAANAAAHDAKTSIGAKAAAKISADAKLNTDPQKQADAELVRKTAAKLKELMALVKMSLRGQPSKEMKDTESAVRDIDKMVKSMTGTESSPGSTNISVDTGIGASASAM